MAGFLCLIRAGVAGLLLAGLMTTSPALSQETGLPAPSLNTQSPASNPTAPVLPAAPVAGAFADDSYRLGTGDKLKIVVYGEDDLSGEFFVDGSGQIQLPLLGQVKAAGLTVHEFVDEVGARLGAKYLRDPKVSVQIENYRPFYIIGEVNKPGEYPYESGLSALGAVALAGGYTYRADDSDIYIRRSGGTTEESFRPTPPPASIPATSCASANDCFEPTKRHHQACT